MRRVYKPVTFVYEDQQLENLGVFTSAEVELELEEAGPPTGRSIQDASELKVVCGRLENDRY